LGVTDAGVDVAGVRGGKPDDVELVVDAALGDADPMAEIDGQFKARHGFQHLTGGPRTVECPTAVCLMRDRYRTISSDAHGFTIETDHVRQAPGIRSAVDVDEQRLELQRLGDLRAHRGEMIVHRPVAFPHAGEVLDHQAQAVLGTLVLKARQGRRVEEADGRLQGGKTLGDEFREDGREGFADTPEMTD
jgi:hypothetical protein